MSSGVDGSSMSSTADSSMAIEDPNKKNNDDRTTMIVIICCCLLLLLLLLLLLGFGAFSSENPDGKPGASDDSEANYVQPPKFQGDGDGSGGGSSRKITVITKAGGNGTDGSNNGGDGSNNGGNGNNNQNEKSSSKDRNRLTSPADPLKSTTTFPWKKWEFLCEYGKTNKVALDKEIKETSHQIMCDTFIMTLLDLRSPEFSSRVGDFKNVVEYFKVGGMLSLLVTGTPPSTQDYSTATSTVKQHNFVNKGVLMYIQAKTTDVTPACIAFAKAMTSASIRPIIAADIYPGWESDFAMDQIAANKIMTMFRSIDFFKNIIANNIPCQNKDFDPTGPKSLGDGFAAFKKSFKDKFEQYKRQVGFYTIKEGQEDVTVPESAFDKRLDFFGILYGKCHAFNIQFDDTDCTANYWLTHAQENFTTTFKPWQARFLFNFHDEVLDKNEHMSCLEGSYVFIMTHPKKPTI